MKNVKRLLVLSMILVLTSSVVLTGCKSNKAITPALTDKKTLSPYELSVYYPGGAAQKDNELVEQEINKYLKDKINATVKLNQIDWASWGDKTKMMIASSQPFDIMFTANWDGYVSNVTKGALLELDPLIDKVSKEIRTSVPEELLNDVKVNGKIYGIPVQKEMAGQAGLIFNKALVDKYKFDLTTVKSIKDIEPMLKKIKDNEKGIIPFLAGGVFNPGQLIDENLNSGESVGDWTTPGAVNTKDGKTIVNQFKTDGFLNSIKFSRDWYLKGYINQDAAIADLGAIVKTDKWFVESMGIKPGKDGELTTEYGYPVVQVPLGKPYQQNGQSQGAMMSISRTSENPERAIMLLSLLQTDKKLVNLIVNGIEAKHYVKVSDNVIDYPSGVNVKASTYNPANGWMVGNQFLDYLWKNEDPLKWDKFKTFNKEAQISPILGFTFNPEKVKTEVASCSNIIKQYYTGLTTGSIDYVKNLPEFQAKIDSIGADKIMKEKQTQLDAYWQTKK